MSKAHFAWRRQRQVGVGEGYLGILEELELDAGLVDCNLCFFRIDRAE